MLLALNCAWTSVDLNELQLKHIEFDSNGSPIRITKIRQKTNTQGTWILFPTTSWALQLYLEHINIKDPNALVFTNRRGKPLLHYTTDEHGNPLTRYDSIGMYFLTKRTNQLSFKHFRKTSASILAQNTQGQYPILEQLLLAHRPSTISHINYVQLDPTLLDAEILKIAESLELDSFRTHIKSNIESRWSYIYPEAP